MVERVDKIWMDGELVDWDQAQVHVLTHTLHYGLGAFEGIRCYKRMDGTSAVFRLEEHIKRLFDTARTARLALRWTQQNVVDACLQTIRVNQLDECYLRPLAFLGAGAMGLYPTDNPVHLTIAVWRWGSYLGDEGLERGVRIRVSSYTRPGVNCMMTKAKIVGNYVNSILAKSEAVATGYQEALLLDPQGYVAEASGENLFTVRDGAIATPPIGASLLAGITRDTVIQLCREMDVPVVERMITRDELYSADEVFFTGTAAEVTPVREIDDRTIGDGNRGPLSRRIQERYFQLVRGPEEPHPEWLARV